MNTRKLSLTTLAIAISTALAACSGGADAGGSGSPSDYGYSDYNPGSSSHTPSSEKPSFYAPSASGPNVDVTLVPNVVELTRGASNSDYDYDPKDAYPDPTTAFVTTENGLYPIYIKKYLSSSKAYSTGEVRYTVAQLKTKYPWMTDKQIENTILTTADDQGETGPDTQYGWGYVDPELAQKGPRIFFGDFVANLKHTHQHSVFDNDIFGPYGLIVKGDSHDVLELKGNNTYTGPTIIEGGRVIIDSLHNPNHKRASLTSPVYVQHNGSFIALDADLGNVVNNGFTQFIGDVHVKGYLRQLPQATLSFIPGEVIRIDGNAYLDGTLALHKVSDQFYVASNSNQFYTLLKARKIIGQFQNEYIESSALISYEIAYYHNQNLVAVNVRPNRIGATSVSLTAADSPVDQQQVQIGVQTIKPIFDEADTLVTPTGASSLAALATADHQDVATATAAGSSVVLTAGTETTSTNPTPATEPAPAAEPETPTVVQLAAKIQHASATELKHLLLAQAGSSYSDLQLATTSQARQSVAEFNDTASRNFLDASLNNQVHAYQKVSLSQRNWSQPQTQLKGQQNLTGFTFGAYGQNQGINYGVAVIHHQGDWHQGMNPVYQDDLATADVEMNGLDFTVGKAMTDSYYAMSVFGNVHKYQVKRTTLAANDQHAKFYGQQVGTSLQYGNKFYHNDYLSLVGNIGTTVSYNNQSGFVETATGEQAAMASMLSLQAKSRHHVDAYVNAGLALKYQFMTFGYKSALSTELSVEQALTKQRFNLELQNGLQTAHAFDQRFMAKLTAGYSVQVSDKLMVKLSGSVQKSKHHLMNKQANLAMSYAFDMN